jgi:tRNA-dihydrouridine synthase B
MPKLEIPDRADGIANNKRHCNSCDTMEKIPKIGSLALPNRLMLAPMLGVNCTAFRLMCHDCGAGLVFSPMIHSMSLVRGERNRDTMIDFVKEERPLAIQLIGRDPEIMVQSIEHIEKYCDLIDLNFGCPDSDILGQKMGAYFAKHPEGMTKIINAVASATKKPVTAKIRIGWDSQSINHVKAAKIVEDAGAAAIIVHGRTKQQQYSGKANWTAIKQVKEKVNIPVVGNGDVWASEDAKKMLEQTGCDFVMIGRGAMGNPHLFTQCNAILDGKKPVPDLKDRERGKLILDFIALYNKVQKTKRFSELKQHALWFCLKVKGAAEKRRTIGNAPDEANLIKAVKTEFNI